MKKLKAQKGITLIALIITIIVLLILAVVTMTSIEESKITTYAEQAAEDTEKAKEEEKITLDILETQIATIGTNLKLDTKYYDSGKDVNNYYIFGSDGYMERVVISDSVTEKAKVKYAIQDNMIRINELDLMKAVYGDEFDSYWQSLPKEEQEEIEDLVTTIKIERIAGNDLIIVSSPIENSLYATSEEGLRYFNDEKYVNGEEVIILTSDKIVMDLIGTISRNGSIPVFYNGIIYNGMGGEEIVVSNDNLETIVYKGTVFTKVTQ